MSEIKNRRLPKSLRKFIREEKARLRRGFFGDPARIKEEINKLYNKLKKLQSDEDTIPLS